MAAAAILKNRKSVISLERFHQFSPNFFYDDAYLASEADTKLKFPTFKNLRWRTATIFKIENRPYLRNGSTNLREIWHDDAYWASELDRKLKFATFKNPRWRTATILKNEKSAIGQYLLIRWPVRVKSAIHRVGKSRIICYIIYFTYFTYRVIKLQKL